MSVKVNVQGIKELKISLEEFSERTEIEINKRLGAIGAAVLREAKTNLRNNGTNTFHNLERSGLVTDIEGGVAVGFHARYAAAVEFGRRAGKRPPMQPIDDWLNKKGLVTGQSPIAIRRRRSAAFLIARNIGRFGTRPQPFFYPAFEKYKPKIVSAMADSINKVIKEVSQ